MIFFPSAFFFFFFWQILMFHRTARGNREPSCLALSTTSTNIQAFICSFASCLIHTNIYVCLGNRNTRWPFDIMYTNQKAFVGANGSKTGCSREALLTQPLLELKWIEFLYFQLAQIYIKKHSSHHMICLINAN